MSRPISVTLLALGVFCLSVFNLVGAITGIQRYIFLSRLPLNVSPIYLIANNILWCLTMGALGLGLWRLKKWGRLGGLIAFSLYVAQNVFDRLVLSRADYIGVTTPFALVFNALSLGVVWAVLWRPKVRESFSA